MSFKNLVAGLVVVLLLAACGGGGGGVAQTPPVTSPAPAVTSLSGQPTNTGLTVDGRKQSADLAGALRFTADVFLDWLEGVLPGSFPKGPMSSKLLIDGADFTVRVYGDNFVGVSAKGDIRVNGPFTKNILMSFGNVGDYMCQISPSACEGGARPGTYRVDGTTHTFLPNYVKGKMTWLGAADGKSYDVAPSDISLVRWNSNRQGWGAGSQASTPPQPDGSLVISGLCNNDRGLPTVITKDGKELWLGFSAQGYQLAGDAAPQLVREQIEYGNYQPALVSIVREVDNTITLVVDFASSCAFGFGKDGALTVFDITKPLMFVWQSDKAGADRKPGWGLGTEFPSIRQAWFDETEAKKGHLLVRFPNMACSDRGGITAYTAKSVSADGTVIYDPQADHYGAGWLIIPKPGDVDPIWQAGPGVTFDGDKFQMAWDTLCLQR